MLELAVEEADKIKQNKDLFTKIRLAVTPV
jgi:hypothetical protein